MAEQDRDPVAGGRSGTPGPRLAAGLAAAALALLGAVPLGASTLSSIEAAIAETEEQIAALEAKRAHLGECADYGRTVVMLPDRGDPAGRRVTRRQLAEIRAALERAYPDDRYRQRREAAYERCVRMGQQWQDTCQRLQQSINELLRSKREHLVDLQNWLAEERRRQANSGLGPVAVFRSGQYAGGCIWDLEIAGATIKGDLYCRDFWGLGRFPLRGKITGDEVRIEVTLAEWAARQRPFTFIPTGRILYVEPERKFAWASGWWEVNPPGLDIGVVSREFNLKPMDVEWPDRTRRPPAWSVYECRAHIKYREQDTDMDAFEKCYAASRAVHERP